MKVSGNVINKRKEQDREIGFRLVTIDLVKAITSRMQFQNLLTLTLSIINDITSPGPNSTPPGSSSASRMCSPNRGGKANPEKSSIIWKSKGLMFSFGNAHMWLVMCWVIVM